MVDLNPDPQTSERPSSRSLVRQGAFRGDAQQTAAQEDHQPRLGWNPGKANLGLQQLVALPKSRCIEEWANFRHRMIGGCV